MFICMCTHVHILHVRIYLCIYSRGLWTYIYMHMCVIYIIAHSIDSGIDYYFWTGLLPT